MCTKPSARNRFPSNVNCRTFILFISALLLLVRPASILNGTGCSHAANVEFIKGADISMLQQIEDNGGFYTENGEPRDLLKILEDHGFNYIRLRLWHSPHEGYNDLEKVFTLASRIRRHGLKFLLNFHYSDTWADPGNQTKPAAWEGTSFETIKDSVYHYTRDVITLLKNRNTPPDMVQIGNEIVCGMLWDDGRICDLYDTKEQWTQFAALLAEGIRGAAESLSSIDSTNVMIHIDRGGDNVGSEWFLDNLLAHGVDFDIIGLSYYPWWHGTLNDMKANLDSLAVKYEKDIVVVETAYPWTLGWCDDTHNIIGLPSQLHEGYPATVEGQKAFLVALFNLIAGVQGGRGIGLFYWAPEYISVSSLGSPWENLSLFDFTGEVINSIEAFEIQPAETNSAGESDR